MIHDQIELHMYVLLSFKTSNVCYNIKGKDKFDRLLDFYFDFSMMYICRQEEACSSSARYI